MLKADRQAFYTDLHHKDRSTAEQAGISVHSEFFEGDEMKDQFNRIGIGAKKSRAQISATVQFGLYFSVQLCKLLKLSSLGMVEAAGVEPASEIIVSRENPCSVRFRRVRLMHSERTRCA